MQPTWRHYRTSACMPLRIRRLLAFTCFLIILLAGHLHARTLRIKRSFLFTCLCLFILLFTGPRHVELPRPYASSVPSGDVLPYSSVSAPCPQANISFRTPPRGGNPSKARILLEASRHCLQLLGLTAPQARLACIPACVHACLLSPVDACLLVLSVRQTTTLQGRKQVVV